MNRIFGGVASLVLLIGLSAPAAAQNPPEVDGEVVHVPLIPPGGQNSGIVLDGDLGDWATLPAIITNNGTRPSPDPANSGQLRWQVAAANSTLYFAGTITDDNIVAGEHGDDYWNEDSIELYVNVGGDLTLTEYGEGVGQIAISPVDFGKSDPTQLTLSGNGSNAFDVTGFVFPTTAGWGFEVGIDLSGRIELVDQTEFGIQVQANGSSGGDRDMKLIWSNADTNDSSYRDPSVFGRAVIIDPAALPPETVADTGTVDAGADDVVSDTATAAGADVGAESTAQAALDSNEPEDDRTLLVAAIISAASILIGGMWFERRRKKSEERAAEERSSNDSLAESAEDNLEDRDALIASILDET